MRTSESPAPSPPRQPTKRRLVWLERGLYTVAVVLVMVYAAQWYRYRHAKPTVGVLSELDPSDRIPLERGAAAGCNVLVITMDTTRADHIGCYGYRSVRTPVIDGLARNGVLFANAFTPSPSTLPGHCSIFTGLYPYGHGARANGTFHLDQENTTLAEILKANGYVTAAFISSYVLDGRFGLDQGFDLYDDDLSKGVKYADHSFRERPAEFTNESALAWLKTAGDARFFAWVHYFDPHAPYLPPEPLRTKYADHAYDGEIAYTDFEIGRLLSGLQESGVLENTLVILAADHGEGLGEHGEATHSLLVYDGTLHTPLVFWLPSRGPLGKVVDRQVSNVDIAPTVLDLLGIEPGVRFDGTSLLRGPEARDETIYAETISTLVLHGWSPLFTVRRQELKYIHAPRPELYDLKEDPKELNNLFEERLEQVAVLSQKLNQHVGQDLFGAKALEQMVVMDSETTQKLAALGYVAAVGEAEIDPRVAAGRDPKDMVPHWERIQTAENNMAMGNFREALEEMEACLEMVPEDVWLLRLLTSAYMEKGDFERAEETGLRALKLEPNDPAVYVGLGRVALGLRRVKEAEDYYNRALQMDPEFASAYVALGSLYAYTEGPAKALEYHQRAIDMDPGTTGPTAHNAIGSMHLGRMDLDQAREAFRQSLEIDPLNGGAHNGLATILIEENELEEAEAELEIALRFMPNHAGVLGTLAALHNKKGEHEEAITLARRALDVNENHLQTLNGLGSALQATGDLPGAKQAFVKALTQDTNYVPCIINLAQVHLSERREEQAAELYQLALRVNPRQPQALLNLGTYKISRARHDEALSLFQRAVEADPSYAVAHRHLGVLLLNQGKPVEALPHLQRSLELDPDQLERERLREMVESLRSTSGHTTQPATNPAPPGAL